MTLLGRLDNLFKNSVNVLERWLRSQEHLLLLSTQIQFPAPMWRLTTPASGGLMPLSDLHGQQAHMWRTDKQTGETFLYVNEINTFQIAVAEFSLSL